MTLRRRVQRLEQARPGAGALANDPEYQLWRMFYAVALEVLTPFPEARAKVERSMSIQEPCIFRPDWEPTAAGNDLRFYFCKESLWAALQSFPEALAALDNTLLEVLGDEKIVT